MHARNGGLTLLGVVRATHPHIKQTVLTGHEIATQGASTSKYATRTVNFDDNQETFMLAKPWQSSDLKSLIRETLDIETEADSGCGVSS